MKNIILTLLLFISYITIAQNSSGTIAKVQQSSKEIYKINILDYGAVPNDGLSDQLALENAIAAATSSGYKIVYIPPGNYHFTDSVVVTDQYIRIEGESPGATTLYFSNQNSDFIVFERTVGGSVAMQNNFNAGLKSLAIIHTTGQCTKCAAITLRGTLQHTIEDVLVREFHHTIQDTLHEPEIAGLVIESAGGSISNQQTKIVNSYFGSCNNGIVLKQGAGTQFINVSVDQSYEYGLVIQGGDLHWIGGLCQGNNAGSIYVTDPLVKMHYFTNIWFEGNGIWGSKTAPQISKVYECLSSQFTKGSLYFNHCDFRPTTVPADTTEALISFKDFSDVNIIGGTYNGANHVKYIYSENSSYKVSGALSRGTSDRYTNIQSSYSFLNNGNKRDNNIDGDFGFNSLPKDSVSFSLRNRSSVSNTYPLRIYDYNDSPVTDINNSGTWKFYNYGNGNKEAIDLGVGDSYLDLAMSTTNAVVETKRVLIGVSDHTDILNHPAPLGYKLITDDGVIYRIEASLYANVPADSLFVIPTQNGYAVQLSLINNDELTVSKGMIIENTGGYNNNNSVLEKAANFIEIAAQTAATSITLNLPAANIYINDTWDIRGQYPSYSFYIKGVGNTNNGTSGTTILYQGTPDTAIIIRDSHHSQIENINFTSTVGTKYLVFVDTFISTVQFQNVTFRCYGDNCQSLLELNRNTPNQISEIYIDNCLFQGDSATDNDSIGTHYVETGISGGYLNNEIIHISESQFLNLDTAIMYNGPGPMTVEKCNFANNWLDIWGGIGNNTIISNYSEHCKRFYSCARYSGAVHSFLMNNDIAGSTPQNVYQGVIVKGAGYGTLINNKFGVNTSDTTFRVQWDLSTDKDILESHYQTADGLYAVNNYFCETSNEPGYRWLVDWSFNETPIGGGTWGKQVKAWNNRGGSNDDFGIDLHDHWDTYITYAESDTNIVAKVNQLMPINVSTGTVTVTPPSNVMPNQWFSISDSRGNAGVNNITVDFITAGYNLHGSSQNYIMNVNNDFQKFLYLNSTIGWIKVH